jgi:ABC-2 type transport system permease protein
VRVPHLSWLRVKAIARRHAFVLARSPHRLFDITVWPLVDVVLFGSVAVFVAGDGSGGRAAFGYLLSGIILWHVVYQSQIALSTGFLEETWSRNLLNIMVTPLHEIEYVIGVALFGLVKLVIGTGFVALTAALFYAFDITELGWGLVPVSAVLLLVGWLIALFVTGLVLRFGTGAEALAWGVMFAILPLSGVFYPVGALPRVMRPLALALPTTHAFAAARALVDGRGLPWGEMGAAAIGSVLLAILVLAFVARMLYVFRARGLIARYS